MEYYKILVKTKKSIKYSWLRFGDTLWHKFTTDIRQNAIIVSEKALGRDILLQYLNRINYDLVIVEKHECCSQLVEEPIDFGSVIMHQLGEIEKKYKVWFIDAFVLKDHYYLYYNNNCFAFTNEDNASVFSYDSLNSDLVKYYLGDKHFFLQEVN